MAAHIPPLTVRPQRLDRSWSADKMLQQLGRTHRTGQACPPEHVLLVTDVCGEQARPPLLSLP